MRQQNGERVCRQLALHQRACGAFVCSLWSAHSDCSLWSAQSFPPDFGTQGRLTSNQQRSIPFVDIVWFLGGVFPQKNSYQIHLAPPAEVCTFLSCGFFYQTSELWILLLHSFAEMKMMGKKQGKIKLYLLLFFRIFWITFITACQPRLTCSEKKYF